MTFYSTHLGDLKALTHDVLYETYRTEKLSRTVHAEQYVFRYHRLGVLAYLVCHRDSSILPEELASQSVRLKEEQLRREEEKVCEPTILGQQTSDVADDAAARDRASRAARDQREEAGAFGERGIAQVRLSFSCLHKRG